MKKKELTEKELKSLLKSYKTILKIMGIKTDFLNYRRGIFNPNIKYYLIRNDLYYEIIYKNKDQNEKWYLYDNDELSNSILIIPKVINFFRDEKLNNLLNDK